MEIIIPFLKKSSIESFNENTTIAALLAFESLAKYMLGNFTGYINITIEILEDVMQRNNSTLAVYAFPIMHQLVVVAGTSDGLSNPAAKKSEIITINGRLSMTLHRVMEWLWAAISSGVAMRPVGCALRALEDVLNFVGIVVFTMRDLKTFQTYGDLMKDKIVEYLNGKAPCQLALITEHDEDGEDDHHDKIVLPFVCDVIDAWAKAGGEPFLETIEQYVPLLLKYTEESRCYTDSLMVVGCFAVSMSEIGTCAMKHVELILPVLKRDCCDVIEENRRNACFCLAIIIDGLPIDSLERYFLKFLDWMMPLLVRPPSEAGDVADADIDNAVAAVCRFIKRCPEHESCPHLTSLVLAALPLNSDYAEGESVYNALISLVTPPRVLSYVPAIFSDILIAFTYALSDDSPYPEDVIDHVKSCLQELSSPSYQQEGGTLDLQETLKSFPLPESADTLQLIESVVCSKNGIENDDDTE
jgi:hypothetical protein